MPTFVGGEQALHHYLATKLVYPVESFRRGQSGSVVVQFIVDEQGRILDPVVLKTSNADFAEEAIRLVRLMPWWTPGQQEGKAVRVRCTLPILFSFKRGN
ncbi:energy transducer TonB [Hymenobacter sp. BRD67]|uniref:energy transducer TonB n=1 Tax=Hymenobacter sp. BRD67 TaxID=2675877 RepID=UPI001563BCC8|nr:energy transducer TonB [Hymenobacter sp. BRD67]QKG51912.1 energy transducer TonB [Hymenobacter sp. BRD67]